MELCEMLKFLATSYLIPFLQGQVEQSPHYTLAKEMSLNGAGSDHIQQLNDKTDVLSRTSCHFSETCLLFQHQTVDITNYKYWEESQ